MDKAATALGGGRRAFCFYWHLLFWGILSLVLEAHTQASGRNDEQSQAALAGQLLGVPAYVLRTHQFAGPDSLVKLEVCFGLVNDVLQFSRDDGRYHAAYEANLDIFAGSGVLIESRTWKRHFYVDAFTATNDRLHLNEERAEFLLLPGKYELQVEISDLETLKHLRRKYPLVLGRFESNGLRLSSLTFAERRAFEGGGDSLQYNLAALLTDTRHNQGIFYEIYGAVPGDTLHIESTISNRKQEKLVAWTESVIADSSRIQRFEPLEDKLEHQGPQTLQIVVKSGGQEISAAADFQVQLIGSKTMALTASDSGWWNSLSYISKGSEFKRIAEATSSERDSLVAEFWRKRDPTPGTSSNELHDEFYRRVDFAATRFSCHGLKKEGWETDRGRIYIVYGPPQEVHHQIGESSNTPYEVWFYPHHRRHFVFRDKNGLGEFELVNR